MVKVVFDVNGFNVELQGGEIFAAFKEKLFIPYEHIAKIDDNADELRIVMKVAGASLGQNTYDFGRFETNEGYGFYAMRRKEDAFAIHLTDERYKVLVLDVDDKEGTINELRSHMTSS